jgi:hypothetical protein
MKTTYTMYIYKADRRCKTGERIFSTTVWQDRTSEGMEREMRELVCDLYPGTAWRFEYVPVEQSGVQ